MKTFLLYKNDVEKRNKNPFAEDLVQDLNLDTIFNAMSGGDKFLYDTAKNIMLNMLTQAEDILYRQELLKDSIANSMAVSGMYSLANKALLLAEEGISSSRQSFSRTVAVTEKLRNAANLLDIYLSASAELVGIINENDHCFKSAGLKSLTSTVHSFFTKAFLTETRRMISSLKEISEGSTVAMGASIGLGLKGDCYILKQITVDINEKPGKTKSKPKPHAVPGQISLYNTHLVNRATDLKDAGLLKALKIINTVNIELSSFYKKLKYETGFYVGCINLYNKMLKTGMEISFPLPVDGSNGSTIFNDLSDISLGINNNTAPVCNSLNADNIKLIVVTGANQGGKSTFLRSLGCAQLMMQCGMFVAASYFTTGVCSNMFTHFSRKEDERMDSGKLDEELIRLNGIVNEIKPGAMVLMNESLSTTSEREGSGIALDIIRAFYDLGIRTIYVTHLYDFANSIFMMDYDEALFLIAGRDGGGGRPFKMEEGRPKPTSFGQDLYDEIITPVL